MHRPERRDEKGQPEVVLRHRRIETQRADRRRGRKLGLITDASGEEFRSWYTHGICHLIGMDVHDVGDYDRPLAAGMAFVVEPGLYIRPQALDQLPNTPQSAAFRAKVGPAVEKYKNIGVRIEDSFVLTATGLKSLSSSVPKTIEEVEAWMKPASPRR